MKKITIIFAAFAALLAVSCEKELPGTDPTIPDGMRKVTITATISDEAEVSGKTSYTQENGTGIFSWIKGDKIAIKGSDNVFYPFTATSSGATSEFVGYLPDNITPLKHALYPAESAGINSDGQYFYTIPEYKDLSKSFSADIPMSSYVSAGTYQFKHMTGAALLTFTNIPDGVDVVEVSVKADGVRLSGTQEIWSGTPFTFSGAIATNESEKTFTRRLAVENNQVQIYLPYKGEFWDNCTINITGYDQSGKSMTLLADRKMKGSSANVFTPGLIIPYTALALPPVFEAVDWSNAVTATVAADAQYSKVKELKVYADKRYMYVRLNSTLDADFAGDYLDIFLSDGDGATEAWWGWSTLGTDVYNPGLGSHKGSIDKQTGKLTGMKYVLTDGTSVNIDYDTKVVDGEVYWYLAYPREYIDSYAQNGTIYVSYMLWASWDPYGVIPTKDSSMLEVILP